MSLRNTTSLLVACRAAGKLFFFLLLLPFGITYLHLSYLASRQGLLLVQTKSNTKTVASNLYLSASLQTTTTSHSDVLYRPLAIPSVINLLDGASILSFPERHVKNREDSATPELIFHNTNQQWCLQNRNHFYSETAATELCSSSTPQYFDGENATNTTIVSVSSISMFHGSNNLASITVSNQHLSTKRRDLRASSFRQNPNRVISIFTHLKGLEVILKQPATCLLAALNIGLAIFYWKYHIHPDAVAKDYHRMLADEPWRSWTGSTAHFELLHLGFNMIALISLGITQQVEFGLYPTISFFLYNISIMSLTSVVWLAIERLRIEFYLRRARQQNNNDEEALYSPSPTVGFSGVLFAWSTIQTLHQPLSCPIPMAPDVCFRTYSLLTVGQHQIAWSLAPVVQLAMAQIVMPRVSFAGHLAGVVVGYLIEWRFLPLETVQPALLVPTLYYLHLVFFRKIIPPIWKIVRQQSMTQISNGELFQQRVAPLTCSTSFCRAQIQKVGWQFCWLNVQFSILVLSALYFGPVHSLTLSFAWTVLFYFHFSRKNKSSQQSWNGSVVADMTSLANNSNGSQKNSVTTVLARGYVVVAVLAIITAAMTLATWAVLAVSLPFFCWWLLIAQCLSLLLSVCFVSSNVVENDAKMFSHESNQAIGNSGIFFIILGHTVITPARQLQRELKGRVVCWENQITSGFSSFADNDTVEDRDTELGGPTAGNASLLRSASSNLSKPSGGTPGGTVSQDNKADIRAARLKALDKTMARI